MPRTGAAIMDLGLLSLAVRRLLPLPATMATAVVVLSTVVIAPGAVKAPVLFAVALAVYSLVRYASGARLPTGLLACVVGVGVARLFLPAAQAHGVTISQLEAILVLGPAAVAAVVRWRGRLPGLHSDPQGDPQVDHRVDPGSDHLLEIGRGLARVASWVEFGRVNRDRLLSSVAAGLVLLVLFLHGVGTGAVVRDVAAIGLAVIAVGSVALVGRWPWPALLVALVAAVLFSGIASLPDAYDSVIGGVVVIGLPLMVAGMLRLRPAAIALGACVTAAVVMGLVTQPDSSRALGPAASCQELLSSVALVFGAWSAGRALRNAGQLAAGTRRVAVGGVGRIAAGESPLERVVGLQQGEAGGPGARRADVSTGRSSLPTLPTLPVLPALAGLPDATTLVQRVSALGLRPTTIRVDQPHGDRLPQRIVEVVGEILDEALLNAARHAPGAELMIKVLREATAIRVEVISGRRVGDTGPTGGSSGQGVPKLARRIAEIGGMFLVGPAAGGFALRALLPLDHGARPGHVRRAGALSDRVPGD
jgi:hypothetical protein